MSLMGTGFTHNYSPLLAKEIGLNEAIILEQIEYWITPGKNGKNRGHLRDGRIWHYDSVRSWKIQFPYWSINTIDRTLNSLRSKGLILTGNYNLVKYDRKKWYTIDYGKFNSLKEKILSETPQEFESEHTQKAPGPVDNFNDIEQKVFPQIGGMHLSKIGEPIAKTSTKTSITACRQPQPLISPLSKKQQRHLNSNPPAHGDSPTVGKLTYSKQESVTDCHQLEESASVVAIGHYCEDADSRYKGTTEEELASYLTDVSADAVEIAAIGNYCEDALPASLKNAGEGKKKASPAGPPIRKEVDDEVSSRDRIGGVIRRERKPRDFAQILKEMQERGTLSGGKDKS